LSNNLESLNDIFSDDDDDVLQIDDSFEGQEKNQGEATDEPSSPRIVFRPLQGLRRLHHLRNPSKTVSLLNVQELTTFNENLVTPSITPMLQFPDDVFDVAHAEAKIRCSPEESQISEQSTQTELFEIHNITQSQENPFDLMTFPTVGHDTDSLLDFFSLASTVPVPNTDKSIIEDFRIEYFSSTDEDTDSDVDEYDESMREFVRSMPAMDNHAVLEADDLPSELQTIESSPLNANTIVELSTEISRILEEEYFAKSSSFDLQSSQTQKDTLETQWAQLNKSQHEQRIAKSSFRDRKRLFEEEVNRICNIFDEDVSLLQKKIDSRTSALNFGHNPQKQSKTKVLKEQKKILLKWFDDHSAHPYANSEQVAELCIRTGLSKMYVRNWFKAERHRRKKARACEEGASPCQGEMDDESAQSVVHRLHEVCSTMLDSPSTKKKRVRSGTLEDFEQQLFQQRTSQRGALGEKYTTTP